MITNYWMARAGELAVFALDKLWDQWTNDQEGCCPDCCLPCSALDQMRDDEVLNDVIPADHRSGSWWVDGGVSSEFLEQAWFACLNHDQEALAMEDDQ